jgi:hypothetical protein
MSHLIEPDDGQFGANGRLAEGNAVATEDGANPRGAAGYAAGR